MQLKKLKAQKEMKKDFREGEKRGERRLPDFDHLFIWLVSHLQKVFHACSSLSQNGLVIINEL